MSSEFEALSYYLTRSKSIDKNIKSAYELKFGQRKLGFTNSKFIIIYAKDTLNIFGFNKDLKNKLLFLIALFEVSPLHAKVFPEKQSKLMLLFILPFLFLAFLISLFID